MKVSKSFVSKQVSKLEKHLNTKLLIRSTRHLALSESGEQFFRHCEVVVLEAQSADANIKEMIASPAGVLKIALPPAMATHLFAPFFAKFLKKYPDTQLQLIMDNRLNDVIKEGFDLVIRSKAKLEDSSLIAQPLLYLNSIICATKKYFQQFGTPQKPVDLKLHNCGYYNYVQHGQEIHFKNQRVHITGNINANHLDVIKQAVLNDLCIAVLPNYIVSSEIKNASLQLCLQDYEMATHAINLIYPDRQFMPLKLKVFIEEIKGFIAKEGFAET